VEESRQKVPPIPLGVLVADLEGGMGYMIAQSLQNKLHLRGVNRDVVTLVAQVIVDRNDPSILNPTKFVGPFFHEHEVKALERDRNWVIKYDEGRGWRRVVPSPIPLEIVEKKVIKKLVDDGVVVITVGGGGTPVYVEDDGTYEGVDGVIDKVYILTAVEKVALNYRKPDQIDLDEITVAEAKQYLAAGQFPPGSMGPKIESAISFIESGGEICIITSTEKMTEAIEKKTGTRIVGA